MDIIEYFERNYKRLLTLAVMMTKDVDMGQDVLHNVAATLLKKQDELKDIQTPSAYVALCIYRATLNYLRKEARSIPQAPEDMAEFCIHPDSSVAYDYAEWIISLETYLQDFSPEMRQAFYEHYLDDMPIDVIAKRLGITPNALSLRFKRMRGTLLRNAPGMLRHIDILSLL